MIGATINPLAAAYADAVRHYQTVSAIVRAAGAEECDKTSFGRDVTLIRDAGEAARSWQYSAWRQECGARCALLAAIAVRIPGPISDRNQVLADEYAEAIRRNQTAGAVVVAIGKVTSEDTDRLRRLACAAAYRWYDETTRRETSARQDLLTMLGEVQS